MAHIQSHHGGAEEAHNTFLVVLKVYGNGIHLWPKGAGKRLAAGQSHAFRISCHEVETHSEAASSDISFFKLSDSEQMHERESCFAAQRPGGERIDAHDLAIFMTDLVPSGQKVSYALDLALDSVELGDPLINMIDEETGSCVSCESSGEQGHQSELCLKLGSAYLYLDPNFSTQGIQRTPIIERRSHRPIGQMQLEYLIVTDPVAYGQPSPRPAWLHEQSGLEAGHRGAGAGRRLDLASGQQLLENTIASFNYAHRHGADMCELDVLVSADGVPVVYHDFDVDAVAAQQSSEQLGKFRVQVNRLSVKQLRDFRLVAMHDDEGHEYTLNVPNQEASNRPFPTLAEVLEQVDESCGLNIEIKWPQLLESGKMEAKRFREINDFVDRIIQVVQRHARNRRIVLESFDADLTLMLRLKQNNFPVFFLSQGMTKHYERYMDNRARSIRTGVYFAQAFGLAGLDIEADHYFAMGKELVDFISRHNLLARAWGDMGETSEMLDLLKSYGLQCVTYDRIDKMKRVESENSSSKKENSAINTTSATKTKTIPSIAAESSVTNYQDEFSCLLAHDESKPPLPLLESRTQLNANRLLS